MTPTYIIDCSLAQSDLVTLVCSNQPLAQTDFTRALQFFSGSRLWLANVCDDPKSKYFYMAFIFSICFIQSLLEPLEQRDVPLREVWPVLQTLWRFRVDFMG